MAVYYKFKSAKDYHSLPICGNFITVSDLKQRIFHSNNLGSGTDFDILLYNASTNEEYPDEGMLIPRNTSVIVRRVPGWPRMPIVVERDKLKASENKIHDIPQSETGHSASASSGITFVGEPEWDEFDFGKDLFSTPEVVPVQSGNPVLDRADEDKKIKALVDTPALDWKRQAPGSVGSGRGFGRGRGGGLDYKIPPQGYICHRCKIPGHFFQHCPTNGDPNFDIKRLKPPTGIPKSMLTATADGSYALPSGAVVVLKPDEAAFEKEIEGVPYARTVTDLLPELYCPLCKGVMKDAVLNKCCFSSFCDKCIRDHIISKSACACGSINVLADDLVPNMTVRKTINRILQSKTSSSSNSGSVVNAQDMKSSCGPQPKVSSPTFSAAVKEECKMPLRKDAPIIQETMNEGKSAFNVLDHSSEKSRATKIVNQSEATLETIGGKEVLQTIALQAEGEIQKKLPVGEQGKKKKKKTCLPSNGDLHWKTSQDFAVENYVMPFGPAYNPYFEGMRTGMDGYMMMTHAGSMLPYMGYTPGVFHPYYGGFLPPQDPFRVGENGYMLSSVPERESYKDMECSRERSVSRSGCTNKKRKLST